MADIHAILQRCEVLWRQQSLSENLISDMRAELVSHLREAQAAGRSTEAVVGPNVETFAHDWAHANTHRTQVPRVVAAASPSQRVVEARKTRQRLVASLVAIVVVTAVGYALSSRTAADTEAWQWAFAISFFVLLAGELLTGSFFVLPFAIGSLCAAILSFGSVEPPLLIVVFIVTSMLALWSLREFASKDDDVLVNVGANRYIDRQAVVIEPINGNVGVGRVRIDTESWLAVSDDNFWYEPGTIVKVTEVRGARVVITPQ